MAENEQGTKRGQWTQDELDLAISAFRNGDCGLNKAASMYGVPKATLKRHLDGANKHAKGTKQLGRLPVLPLHVEKELKEHILGLERMFFGVTRKDLMSLAYELAEFYNLKHSFSHSAKSAGNDWYKGFMKRNPDLSLRQPESTSIMRASGFNKPAVNRFFDLLETLIGTHNYQGSQIFNVDESGLSTVQKKCQKIVGEKGKHQIGALSSQERGVNTTVVCCFNVPPIILFKRKRMPPELSDGAPPESLIHCNDSGWMDKECFTLWLKHFLKHVKPSKEKKILIILDGHRSHTMNIEAINLAKENFVEMLSLPPHTTHKLQPLDRSFFKPLQSYYDSAVQKWLRNHPGRAVGLLQVSSLFCEAYLKAAIMPSAINGFRSCGIYPCSRDVFEEHEFAPSFCQQLENVNQPSFPSSLQPTAAATPPCPLRTAPTPLCHRPSFPTPTFPQLAAPTPPCPPPSASMPSSPQLAASTPPCPPPSASTPSSPQLAAPTPPCPPPSASTPSSPQLAAPTPPCPPPSASMPSSPQLAAPTPPCPLPSAPMPTCPPCASSIRPCPPPATPTQPRPSLARSSPCHQTSDRPASPRTFKTVETIGDGRCFFRAIAISMNPSFQRFERLNGRPVGEIENLNEQICADALHTSLIQHMISNLDSIKERVVEGTLNVDMPSHINYSSILDRIREMAKPSTMVGEIEIYETAKSLQKTIHIYTQNGSKLIYTGNDSCDTSDREIISLKFTPIGDNCGHYECLIPEQQLCLQSPLRLPQLPSGNDKKRKHRKTRAEIITSSPYKKQLEERLSPKVSKRKRLNAAGSSKSHCQKGAKAKKCSVSSFPKSMSSTRSKSKGQKLKPQSTVDSEAWYCFMCGESTKESMICCRDCKRWTHVDCAGTDSSQFICELCQ